MSHLFSLNVEWNSLTIDDFRFLCGSIVSFIPSVQVASDVWAHARHCAHTSSDTSFGLDVHRVHCFGTLISAAFEVQVLSNAVHKAGAKYEQRGCTMANCKIIRAYRNAHKDFDDSTNQADADNAAAAAPEPFVMTCGALDGKFVWPDLRASAAELKATLIDRFKALWTADLSTFSAAISEYAIDLTAHKEDFLTKEKIMDDLIKNVDSFSRLPKACGGIRDIYEAVRKSFSREERVVCEETLKSARKVADCGIQNVVYTLIAFYVKDELQKAANPIIVQRCTKEIRNHASSHNVPLPETIKKALDDLDSGSLKPADLLPKKTAEDAPVQGAAASVPGAPVQGEAASSAARVEQAAGSLVPPAGQARAQDEADDAGAGAGEDAPPVPLKKKARFSALFEDDD